MIIAGKAHAAIPIERIEVSSYAIPTDFPESDGTLEWNSTTLVLVEAQAGKQQGLGYTYGNIACARLIEDMLAEVVRGRDAMAVSAAWEAMNRAVRNLGRAGIASMAISAVDTALWDLKAKLLETSLVTLLGPARETTPVYGSGGFTSYSVKQLQQQLASWVESGIAAVKMKVGRNPHDDAERVRAARAAIGEGAQLFVDANGAYQRKEALARAAQFAECQVTWFEEPVSSDDLAGLRLIRDRGPQSMEVAAGEYGYDSNYFRRMLSAGAVDVLQADATRCGGITGFMQVGALCEAFGLSLSAHTAPSIHAGPCCALNRVRHIEYFHDHVRIEQMLFDGAPTPIDGSLRPDSSRPGIGLEFKRIDAARYQL